MYRFLQETDPTTQPPAEEGCTFHYLIHHPKSPEFLCNAAKTLCAEKFELLNFLNLYWCDLDGNLILLLTLYIASIFIIFKYTSLAVDEVVVEAILRISTKLGLSEALSAVTLLAFANGAGELITALIASGTEGGISYNIGALYGAGFFTCSLIISICIFQSKEPIVFDKMIVFRDIGIYLTSTLLTLAFGAYGYITWVTSVILISLYGLLVVLVIIEDSRKKGQGDTALGLETPLKDSLEQGSGGDEMELQVLDADHQLMRANSIKDVLLNNRHFKAAHHKLQKALVKIKAKEFTVFLIQKLKLRKDIKHSVRKGEASLGQTISHYIDLPAHVLYYSTTLPPTDEEFSKNRCLVWSFTGVFFIYWNLHPTLDITYLYIALPISLVLFGLFKTQLKDNNEAPSWSIILCVVAAFCGILWIKLFMGFLIDMLQSLPVLLNLGQSFLGFTILAIGNALPDAYMTISLCSQGVGTMAISGGYAGQLFGYLIGFGVSMLKLTLHKGPQVFSIFDFGADPDNLLSFLVVMAALTALILTAGYALKNKYVMDRTLAKILMSLYLVFLVSTSIYAVFHAISTP